MKAGRQGWTEGGEDWIPVTLASEPDAGVLADTGHPVSLDPDPGSLAVLFLHLPVGYDTAAGLVP